jgi:hypothetical protein
LGQGISTIPRSGGNEGKDQREKQGQGPGDEKIDTYITVVGRVWYRFTIDINRIRLNNI